MHNVLYFTKYDRLGASSRLRTYQYLTDSNEQYKIYPLFSDRYLLALYSKRKFKYIWLLYGYLLRVYRLIIRDPDDVLVVEKELFPWLPWWFEKIFYRDSVLVIDIDDAIYHNYDHGIGRVLLSNKFKYIFGYSKLVLAGNSYLLEYAKSCGASHVELFPTVVNMEKYCGINNNSFDNDMPIIVWIGSPSTQAYLYDIMPCLNELYQQYPFILKIIGASTSEYLNYPFVKIVKWDENNEGSQIASSDIGIMPLPDRPFERGKCGYKLLQFMASSLPVVASPVGVNTSLVKSGQNGYLCSSYDEWFASLKLLLTSHELRKTMGECGKHMVANNYSLEVQKNKYFKMLLSVK